MHLFRAAVCGTRGRANLMLYYCLAPALTSFPWSVLTKPQTTLNLRHALLVVASRLLFPN